MALVYAAHMFIDKLCTRSNWTAGLTLYDSTLSTARRQKMITYAIYDCFTTTYFIRPVLEKWTFKQLKNINIIELFTSFKSPPLPTINLPNKKILKNANLQKLFNIFDDELEPISDDEIYLNQLIGPINEKQTSNDEQTLNNEQELNERQTLYDQSLVNGEEFKSTERNEEQKPPATVQEPEPIQQIQETTQARKHNRKHHERPT